MASSQAEAAKCIRKELREAFPTVKFTVRSESFSMGDAVRISYWNGPTTKEVQAITDKYQYGTFNGMEDIYELKDEKVDLPQSKYVQVSREYGYEATRYVVDKVNEQFGLKIECKKVYCNYAKREIAEIVDFFVENMQEFSTRLIGREAWQTNFLKTL